METVRALGEVRLIRRLARRVGRAPGVRTGIGDDAAVLVAPGGTWWLLASDMLVEGVHFRRTRLPAFWIGWKALAVNLSDIAAMGGRPRWALVSLGLPPQTPVRFVDDVYRGLNRCARGFGVGIVGGDTVRAPRVIIDVAILGTVRRRHLTLRSGARVGDGLFVTGRLGGAVRSGRHGRVRPRIREAHELLRRVPVRAMIDLSDGLAADLWQLARASRVTLRVEAARLPVSRDAPSVHAALMEGEDFELLFAVARRNIHRVPRRLGSCPVTRIGSVVRPGPGVELADSRGRVRPLIPTGFRHF